MEVNDKKKLAAKLSIISNITLTTLKIIAGIFSGSLSIISEAVHSMSDFAASVVTFFSVVKSSKPADNDHPYGHGKYEDMAGLVEGILIIMASFFIIYESSKKIIFGIPSEMENNLGISVMVIAVIFNLVVSSILLKIAKETNSVSLYADGEHLRVDVYSSLGVLIGLVLIKQTGITLLDPIIAMFIAIFIYLMGYSICKKSMMRLLDFSLPDEDIKKITQILNEFKNITIKEDSIKARQCGPSIDIDFTLQFSHDTSICKCHKICDDVEKRIQAMYPNSSISIHSEPNCYKKNCPDCCVKSN